jgi:DNA mismatch endonuclease, patch repair protein
MSRVHSTDTSPELVVRRALHRAGFRYRLHRKDLPGTPDLAFPGRRKALFVHGCFWHGHTCARGARTPKSNRDYWQAKIARNKARDTAHQEQLRALGWDVLVVWECEVRDRERLMERLRIFLRDHN